MKDLSVGKILLGSIAYTEYIHAQPSERVNISPSVLGVIGRYKNNIHKINTSGIENLLFWRSAFIVIL